MHAIAEAIRSSTRAVSHVEIISTKPRAKRNGGNQRCGSFGSTGTPLFSKLIILDLRRQDEVDQYPYIIPAALLTKKVDVPVLITWLPLRSWVVLYATDDVPRSYSRLRLLRNDLSFYVLSTGLRAWWSAGFAMETVSLYASLRVRD